MNSRIADVLAIFRRLWDLIDWKHARKNHLYTIIEKDVGNLKMGPLWKTRVPSKDKTSLFGFHGSVFLVYRLGCNHGVNVSFVQFETLPGFPSTPGQSWLNLVAYMVLKMFCDKYDEQWIPFERVSNFSIKMQYLTCHVMNVYVWNHGFRHPPRKRPILWNRPPGN